MLKKPTSSSSAATAQCANTSSKKSGLCSSRTCVSQDRYSVMRGTALLCWSEVVAHHTPGEGGRCDAKTPLPRSVCKFCSVPRASISLFCSVLASWPLRKKKPTPASRSGISCTVDGGRARKERHSDRRSSAQTSKQTSINIEIRPCRES